MAELPVGREARGKAGVFGSSINPLSVYMQYSAQRQRNRAAREAQQRAERDKAMDYLDEYNKTSKFNELNYRVAERIQRNVRDPFTMGLQAGVPIVALKNQTQKAKAIEEAYIEETNAWKEKIDALETAIKADPIRYKTGENSAISAVRDIYKNPDGTLRSDDEIRQSLLNADALKYDPRVLNTDGVVKSFIEKLPEQSRVLLTKSYSAMGYSPDEIENLVKSGLTYEMEKDPATGQMRPALDDELLPKVVVDEKLYRLAKADPYMNSLMNAASPNKSGQMDWLRQNIRGQGDKVSIDRQVVSGKKMDADNDPNNIAFGINFGRNVADIEARRDWLDKATSGNRPDLLKAIGNVTKDIKADYSPDKKKIVITFPSGLEDPELMNNPNLAGIMISPGKAKGTVELDISTPQNKRAARQALSEIIDSQLRDSKQAIGTDAYVRYEEAYAKSKQKGASGIKWK